MLKTWSIALLLCASTAFAAEVIPKAGLYEADDPESYFDVAIEVQVEGGYLKGLTEVFDPEYDPSAPYYFTCDGLVCTDNASAGHIVTIVSETQFQDDWDGDANYYFFKKPLPKAVVAGQARRGKRK